MNPFETFSHPHFGDIRIAVYDDNMMFVGRDVAAALGYLRPDTAIKRHVAPADTSVALVPLQRTHRRMVIINTNGVRSLAAAANTPQAQDFLRWIDSLRPKTDIAVSVVKGVRGYVDNDGTVWLNVADVARGLGFVQTKNGVEYPRYDRISGWLKEYGFPHAVGKDDFIPENMFYRLAMKASNAAAQKFQSIVADEILPSIRKTGSYSVADNSPDLDRLKLLVELIAAPVDCPVKEQLFRYTANLIIGKNIF